MIKIDQLPHRRHDEEVLVTVRRDVIVMVYRVIKYALLSLLPIAMYLFIKYFYAGLLTDAIIRPILALAGLTYYMFIWVFFYREFLDYYLDVWMVTNHRILSIELQGFFNRVISEHKLFRIQDVTTEQKGFLANIFNYGEVYIQTAGTQQRFIFEQVPDPNKVSRQIVQLIEWHKKAYPDDA